MAEAAGEVKLIMTADAATWSQAIDKAKAQLKQLEGQVGSSSTHMRHEMTEAKGSIALLGEEIGVHLPRHVRSFIASMPGVASAMAAAFSTVAVVAIGMAAYEAGKKVYEFIEKSREAAEKNAKAWDDARESVHMANLELSASTIHLQNELAKLEHKPENKLAESIADTALATEKLQEKLQGAIGQAEKLLKEQAPGFLSQLVLGTRATDPQQKLLKEHEENLRKAKTMADQLAESQRYGGELAEQRTTLTRAQSEAGITPSPIGGMAGGMPVPLADYSKQLDAVTQLQANQVEEQERIQNTLANDAAAADVKKAQAQAAADAEAKRANAEKMQQWRRDLDAWRAVYDASAQDVATYWQGIVESIKRNAPLAAAAQEEFNKAQKTANDKYQEDLTKGWIKGSQDFMQSRAEDERIGEEVYRGMHDAQKAIDEATREQQRAARENFENTAAEIAAAERIAEETIKIQEARGQLSRLAAAMGIQQLHEQAAGDWRRALGVAQNAGAGITLREIEGHGAVEGRRAQMDQAAVESATALGALRDAAGQLIGRLVDMPAHIQQLVEGTVSTLNDAILRTLTDPYHRGAWKDAGRSVATGVARSGLELAEGTLAKHIPGLAHFGKLGSPGNLMHVSVDAAPGMAAGGAAGGVAGSLGTLAGKVAGGAGGAWGGVLQAALGALAFMDSGGPIASGMPAIVGESGPELFIPSTSGRVVSNSSMAGLGGVSNVVNVDARGAGDPAAVEMAVHRTMQPYLRALPSMTVNAMQDYNARRPAGYRA